MRGALWSGDFIEAISWLQNHLIPGLAGSDRSSRLTTLALSGSGALVKATISADGKLALPEELLRNRLFEAGTQFDVVAFGDASFLLKKIAADAPSASGGMAEWLFSCPEKDWFAEPDRSEMLRVRAESLFDE